MFGRTRCHLALVDGAHHSPIVNWDLHRALECVEDEGYILLDDVYNQDVQGAIEEAQSLSGRDYVRLTHMMGALCPKR